MVFQMQMQQATVVNAILSIILAKLCRQNFAKLRHAVPLEVCCV